MTATEMQFDVQTVKLPSSIGEKPAILSCQVQNSSGTPEDVIRSYNQSQRNTNNVPDTELITPKKLTNPCLESLSHQHLHKELLFNNKIGKNVLNQKSELHKALEKYKNSQMKKEQMRRQMETKTAFEKAIEERAKKIESVEKSATLDSEKLEFLQIHAKLCAKNDTK